MIIKFEIPNLRFLWWWFRQVSGDAAYENYLDWAGRNTPTVDRERGAGAERRCEVRRRVGENSLSPTEFYVERLKRRYNGISRCC